MTTHPPGADANTLTPAQHAAWAQYQRLRVRLSGHLSRELARAELSEAEFEVMLALRANGESVRALALRCGLAWEKSRLSHQLRRMEARGLITRTTCEEDGRSTVILLTDSGRERLAAATTHYRAAVAEVVMGALSQDELEAFATMCGAILDRLDAANPDTVGQVSLCPEHDSV